jgi:hypothetical protein
MEGGSSHFLPRGRFHRLHLSKIPPRVPWHILAAIRVSNLLLLPRMMKVDDCHKPAIVTCSRHLVYVDDRKSVAQHTRKVAQSSRQQGLANVIRHRTKILRKVLHSTSRMLVTIRNYCFSIVCVYVIHSPYIEFRHPIKRWLSRLSIQVIDAICSLLHQVHPVHYVTF